MKKSFLSIFVLVLSIICNAQVTDLNQKLPTDKSVRVGKLSNGMSYFIKQYSNPKELFGQGNKLTFIYGTK